MEIKPCRKEVEKYLPKMEKFTKETIEKKVETCFSIGITPGGREVQRIGVPTEILKVPACRVPLPIPPERSFLLFHTHPPGAATKGLGPEDTLIEPFPTFDYFCVANPDDKSIRCYRPSDVRGDPAYGREVDAFMRNVESFYFELRRCDEKRAFQRLPPIGDEVIELISKPNHSAAVSLLREGECTEALRMLEEAYDRWNKFIVKKACATFTL